MKKPEVILALSVMSSAILTSCALLTSSPLPPARPSHFSSAYQPSAPEDLPPKCEMFFPVEVMSDIKYAAYESLPTDVIDEKEVYSLIFEIPLEGGSYEFECESGQFYISKVYDSSMEDHPKVNIYIGHSIHQNCRHRGPQGVQWEAAPITTSRFKYVHASAYTGSFYKITCNQKQLKHTWRIDVDPFYQYPVRRKHQGPLYNRIETSDSGSIFTRSIYVIMWDKTDECDFVFQFEQGDFEQFTGIE